MGTITRNVDQAKTVVTTPQRRETESKGGKRPLCSEPGSHVNLLQECEDNSFVMVDNPSSDSPSEGVTYFQLGKQCTYCMQT